MSSPTLSKKYLLEKYSAYKAVPVNNKYFPYLGIWGHQLFPLVTLGRSYEEMKQGLHEVS